jgi:hypothetical protein
LHTNSVLIAKLKNSRAKIGIIEEQLEFLDDISVENEQCYKLAEIYSMHGTFEWFGNRYLRNGFEIGFVGASDDHRAQPGAPQDCSGAVAGQGGLAAVLAGAQAGRDLCALLAVGLRHFRRAHPARRAPQRQSMGTRQPDMRAQDRVPRLRHRMIDRIDVVRNGEIVYSRHYLGAPLTADVGDVRFRSRSDVYRPRAPIAAAVPALERCEVGGPVSRVLGAGLDNVILDQLGWIRRARTRPLQHPHARAARRAAAEARRRVGAIQVGWSPPEGIGRPDTVRRRRTCQQVADAAASARGRAPRRELHVGQNTDRVTIEIVDRDAAMDATSSTPTCRAFDPVTTTTCA